MSEIIFNPVSEESLQLYPSSTEFDSRYLKLTGGTMTGNLIFSNSQSIIGGTTTTANLTLQTTSGVGTTGADMHFNVGNNGATKAMTILNSGNVGIGTTNPEQKLTIVGTSQVAAGGGSSDGILRLSTGTGLFTDNSLDFGIHDSDYSWIQAVKPGTNYFNLILNALGGNVGIGTTNPTYKLEVDGNVSINEDGASNESNVLRITQGRATFGFDGTLGQAYFGSGTGKNMAILSGGTAAIFINTTGSVGIGTTSPGSLLSLKSVAANESATLGSELLSSSGWTSTNWTGDWATGWTHTVGFTDALSNTLAAVINNYYQIAYTVTGRTAGSFTVAFGGQSKESITATGTFGPRATTTSNLVITPTSDFNGTVVISIKQITGNSLPTFALYDNTGTSNLEMRSSLNTLSNTFIGKNAGAKNTTGSQNSAQGYGALQSNTTGNYNSAQGIYALQSNTTGYSNSAQGVNALFSNTTGYSNSAQGVNALFNLTGSYGNNTALGANSGRYYNGTTGNLTAISNSLFLGASASALNATGDTNEIVIGYNAIGNGSNSVTLGNTGITKTILQGNVGIGTTTPNANAILDITSTTKAFMPPRMTTVQKNAVASPTAGMVIFDSTLNKLCVYGATAWETITSA